MRQKKIVVALGGNSIKSGDGTARAQQKKLEMTAIQLVKLIEEGHQVVITHGNGPQVGNIYLQQVQAESPQNPAMPLDTCGAMSQGMIGYWLANAIDLRLKEHGIAKQVAPIITRVEVDPMDIAFLNPSKPIGPFYSAEEAKALMEETGETYVEDAGRGWRKVVPSPQPVAILEHPIIDTMLEHDHIVIAAGGGGVPVYYNRGRYVGIEAVIDKDFASLKLAEAIDADVLMMLTEVDHAYIHFGTDKEAPLTTISSKALHHYMKEDHFAPGSMLPKVQAAIDFADSRDEREAIITSLEHASEALDGVVGTRVIAESVHGYAGAY
ncbi:carbamate kinase [Oceanobacillus halotolerans]|uniref:carbamate kinase n=1 Tax=Oceanobacillus halotolerans TaxID=2663380 RepID=UPI0013D9FC16|nr:carbamate kinase [Oceanobacillus halotolerans]